MNPIFVATFLCMGALVSGNTWNLQGLAWGSPLNSWAHGGAPLGLDGNVVDTPAVAIAKANLLGATVNAGSWAGAGLGNVGLGLSSPLNSWGLGGAPIGIDGRVVDTPAVAIAKANHLAAKINTGVENSLINGGAWGNSGLGLSSPLNSWGLGGAPIGIDGRVVDTPAVAIAKANHLAAKINTGVENSLINGGALANSGLRLSSPLNSWSLGGAPIGIDGRVVDTPAVAIAKANHLAAKINTGVENSLINGGALANSGLRLSSPLNSWSLGGAPIGIDGRVVDTLAVAIAKANHLAAKINAGAHGAW